MQSSINDYTIETLLGKGTFGSVYLVRRKRDLKPFVVKKQILNSENTLIYSKIVLEEVRCLQKMRHPNIVSYHEAWTENDCSYILMEYATRCTLKDLLEKREAPLREEDAFYLFSQIVLGVHHIHLKKILHRDLKPENIMLTGSRGDIVKIGDFGVSKNLQELRDSLTTCRAGSYYYMAPEMLSGQLYNYKSDVWSMGVVLYEMITKKLPFPSATVEEIVKLVQTGRPKPLPGNISEPMVNLISKMLRKQFVARPSTDQLLFCPFLVPFIIKVYLNLGRTPGAPKDQKSLRPELFLKFMKPCNANENVFPML